MAPRRSARSQVITAASDSEAPSYRSLTAALLVALLLVSAVAEGSVLRGLTVQQLRRGAEAIVVGRVVAVEHVRTDTSIETLVQIRVERAWRGDKRRRLTVRVPGGEAGARQLVVPGAPSFREGESVLLFLYEDGDAFRPVGMFQGVWRLGNDDPRMARASDSGGASLLLPDSGALAVDRAERSVTQLVGRQGAEQ